MAIIAPLPVKERDRMTGEETGDTMMFKTVFVFDRAQVAPIEGREQAPLGPPCEPLTGDSHAHLLAPIRVFAESLGFSVSFESIPGETGGWCDQKARRIVVDAHAPANAQLRILIHETVHARRWPAPVREWAGPGRRLSGRTSDQRDEREVFRARDRELAARPRYVADVVIMGACQGMEHPGMRRGSGCR